MQTRHPRATNPNGFSLIELLFVIAIGTVMIALVSGSFHSISRSLSLTRGGDDLADAILGARQKAIAASDAVEIRFYDLPSEEDDAYVTVLQVAYQKSDGSYRAENPVWMPAGIGISRNPQLSSFFQTGEGGPAALLIHGVAGESFPDQQEAEYVAFRYLADGSTNLPEEKWFLTVTFQSETESEEVPANFYTIQIDPALGQIQTFRP